jgi:hypothetical protein
MDSDKLRVSKPVISLMVVLAAVTCYWMFTYSGPYRYLAELEIKWLGEYNVGGTFALVALGCALLVAIVFGIVRLSLFGVPKDVAARLREFKHGAMHQDVFAAMPPPWVRLRLGRVVVLLTCFGMSAWFYYNGATAGALQQLDAADFQGGKVHGHVVFADVRGRISQNYLANGQDDVYIPMTSSAGPSAPVQVLVSTTRSQMRKQIRGEADGTCTVRGIADKWLSADIKYAFAKNGYMLADSVWVVRAGHSPSSEKEMALIAVALGIVLAAIFKYLENRARRRAAPSPTPVHSSS